MSLNRVVLVGRLVADPELKYTPAGKAVASMRIAVNRLTKNDQGDYEADFFNVIAWDKTADFASHYLNKGRLVSVDGRLQARSWVDQASGQKRSTVEIVAEKLEGLDRRGDTEGAGGAMEGEARATPASAPERATAPSRAAAPIRNAPPVDDALDESDPFADE